MFYQYVRTYILHTWFKVYLSDMIYARRQLSYHVVGKFYHTSSCTMLCCHRRYVYEYASSIRQTNLLLHMRANTEQYKTNKLLLHTALTNEPTGMYIHCLLYLRTRNVYQKLFYSYRSSSFGRQTRRSPIRHTRT